MVADLEYIERAKDLVRQHVNARYKLDGGWTRYDINVESCDWTEKFWAVVLSTSKLDQFRYVVSYDGGKKETTVEEFSKVSISVIKDEKEQD